MRKLPAIVISLGLMAVLLIGTIDLPEFGKENTPQNNELFRYYIENTTEETGALNIITGIILDYRALDTFVEASVLFTSAITVMAVLKKDNKRIKMDKLE